MHCSDRYLYLTLFSISSSSSFIRLIKLIIFNISNCFMKSILQRFYISCCFISNVVSNNNIFECFFVNIMFFKIKTFNTNYITWIIVSIIININLSWLLLVTLHYCNDNVYWFFYQEHLHDNTYSANLYKHSSKNSWG